MKFANYFDRVYGLYLDKRIQNYEKMNSQIEHIPFICGDGSMDLKYDYIDRKDLPPVYENSIDYPTWWVRPNAFNAWHCHKQIMSRFYNDQAKPERLLLLEDDIELSEEFEDIVWAIDPFIQSNKWDMLYFGCYQNGMSEDYSCEKTLHLRKMRGGGGFHGVAMTREIVGQLLEFAPIGPFDWVTGKYLHPKYRCYGVYPTIINQVDGYSFVEDCNLTKPSKWSI